MTEKEQIKIWQKEYREGSIGNIIKFALAGGNILGQIKEVIDLNANIQRESLIMEIVERVQSLEEKNEIIDEKLSKYETEKLLNYSMVKASNCHSKIQINKMSDVIMSAAIENKIEHSDAEVLISIISEMNTSEGLAFSNIYNNLKDKGNVALDLEFDDTVFGSEKYRDLSDRLISKGLIRKIIYKSQAFWDGGSPLNDYKYKFTYYGLLFIENILKSNYNIPKLKDWFHAILMFISNDVFQSLISV